MRLLLFFLCCVLFPVIDKLEKELEAKVKELEFKQTSLKTDLSDIDIRVEKGNKCLEARNDVQKVYNEAISKAGSETDPEKKEIAAQLINYWETTQKEHEKSLTMSRLDWKNAEVNNFLESQQVGLITLGRDKKPNITSIIYNS